MVKLLFEIIVRLIQVLGMSFDKERATTLKLTFVKHNPIQFIGDGHMILKDNEKVTGIVNPLSAAGNPAPVDGVPVWASSDPAIVTVEAAPDGLSAVVSAVGPLGTAQVSVQADADMGTGVKAIVGVGDVQVVASDATTVAITFGTPEPK